LEAFIVGDQEKACLGKIIGYNKGSTDLANHQVAGRMEKFLSMKLASLN